MLVATGGGSFWYEVCTQFPEALEASVLSLEDLLGRLSGDDALFEKVQTLTIQWADVLDGVKSVLSTEKRKKKRRR